MLHFIVPPGFTGYASFILNVTGSVAATPATRYGATDPFAGSSALVEVHSNAYDGTTAYFVATGMGDISFNNWVDRFLVDDPEYVGDIDHFDPVKGEVFYRQSAARYLRTQLCRMGRNRQWRWQRNAT